MKKLGIYVHIPFCRSKCLYCDFNSYANMENSITPYFSALLKETEIRAKEINSEVDTIYFGGGTPTSVDPKMISAVLEKLFSLYNISPDAEITIECNPGTIGFEGLSALRKSGINRLSLGLQSTDNHMLSVLGRIHTFEDFKHCLTNARKAGFNNISLDLMYGLPDMTLKDWENTLCDAISFDTEHISCYSLKVEDGTPFSAMQLNLPSDDLTADMYEVALSKLEAGGYSRYEISNFSKPGFTSQHNLKYWHCDDFLGLGAGAYSSIKNRRFSNICSISDYINAISLKGLATQWQTDESDTEKMSEFMFLGLRCTDGVSDKEFKARFNTSFTEVYSSAIKKYTNWGFLIFDGDRLKFSDKAFFVSNTILSEFV